MSAVLYFAYGSNMLTARLRQRCPTARPVGLAIATGYTLSFSKIGLDGSGKATLRQNLAHNVYGVLFELSRKDLPALDRAEARYDRIADFTVADPAGNVPLRATSYVAPPEACDAALIPFDWYHALIVAGGREHGLPAGYIEWLEQVTTRVDMERDRPGCVAAMKCLAHAAD